MLKLFKDKSLSDSVVQELIDVGQCKLLEKRASVFKEGDITPEMVRGMLACIPFDDAGNVTLTDHLGQTRVGYVAYRDLIFSISCAIGPDATHEVVQNNSDARWHDDKGGSHVYTIAHSANGTTKAETLIYHARLNGYQLPPELAKKYHEYGRQPGPAVLDDVLGGGAGYISLGGVLYQYDGHGLYVPVDMEQLRRTILEYFTTYPSRGGKATYARTECVAEAVSFLITHRIPDVGTVINPPGCSYKNCMRLVSYGADGIPTFKTVPHTPDIIFTTRSKGDFQPDTELEAFNQCYDDILGDRKTSEGAAIQEIYFRTLAAGIDMHHARKCLKKMRLIKAIILGGEGTNGKDTGRVHLQALFGGDGFTEVTLQEFRNADSEKRTDLFSIARLRYSAFNWAIESGKVLLDTCETLKKFISGDTMHAVDPHGKTFTFIPKVPTIFNVNKMPALRGNTRAMVDRFCLIVLPHTFVPENEYDGNNPRHRKIIPKFKDDPDFIRENILPALGNRLEQAFIDLCREGKIDYSVANQNLTEAQKDSSHIYQFLDDQCLEACVVEKGMLVQQAYDSFYGPWANGERYIVDSAFGGRQYSHPHDKYDQIIRHHNQFLKRLLEVHPGLPHKRTAKGTLIGLKQVQGTSPKYPCLLDSCMKSMR